MMMQPDWTFEEERMVLRFSKEAFALAQRIEQAADRLNVEPWRLACALSGAARRRQHPLAGRYREAAEIVGCWQHLGHKSLYLLVDEGRLAGRIGRVR